MKSLALFVSTCAYVGYFPIAPGTAGSIAGLLVYFALQRFDSLGLEVAAIVVLFVAGIWSGSEAERHFGTEDPGPVVLDEVVGMLITLAFIPASVGAAVFGFLAFRAFDIVKPYPASRLERWPGGLGIMADDAMAAVYSNLVVRATILVFPHWFA